jgi:hypothetical protein
LSKCRLDGDNPTSSLKRIRSVGLGEVSPSKKQNRDGPRGTELDSDTAHLAGVARRLQMDSPAVSSNDVCPVSQQETGHVSSPSSVMHIVARFFL